MVMLLRKRIPRTQNSPSYETDSESETLPLKKSKKILKPTKKIETFSSESEFDSDDSDKEDEGAAEYEKIREQRIRENKERMEKLGIFSLSSQLLNADKKKVVRKKNTGPNRKRYPPICPQPRSRSYDSFRRSDRLKDVASAHYIETEGTLKDMGILIPNEWKSEVYTEEDEKRLGDCETVWNLNEDGFGEDGERLYNPDGTPCHQCRQKTLGKLTYCGKCKSAQGQLCGDCLYTRYGENVLEAVQNPAWSCPACRDICNCSRCRRTKGWQPINIPHSKVTAAGFKSVAHYIILTRRSGAKPMDLHEESVVIDLTEEKPTAPQPPEGSDYSADSSEYDSGDSDSDDESKHSKKNKDQSAQNQVGTAEGSIEPDVAAVPAVADAPVDQHILTSTA
ncbi:unnamed protein product [Amaranthus hypochondriacus]